MRCKFRLFFRDVSLQDFDDDDYQYREIFGTAPASSPGMPLRQHLLNIFAI